MKMKIFILGIEAQFHRDDDVVYRRWSNLIPERFEFIEAKFIEFTPKGWARISFRRVLRGNVLELNQLYITAVKKRNLTLVRNIEERKMEVDTLLPRTI